MMKFLAFTVLLTLSVSCAQQEKPIAITAEDYHTAVDRLTSIQVHDIFSPPVASRIYAYSNIAAYEAMRTDTSHYKSLTGQVRELTPVPEPTDTLGLNHRLASIVAFYEVGRTLIFSEDRITLFCDSLYRNWEEMNPESFKTSKAYGLQVAEHIKKWMAKDNYAQTRTMPKFAVRTDDKSRWQPTPPAYMDGIEPNWDKIRPFVIKASDQFKPVPPPLFSMEKGSPFYKEMIEVYEVGSNMHDQGEGSARVAKAQFWDCNPYVSTHKGHLMFATKKITPGGHWIGITKIACRKAKASFEKSVEAYTETSIAMADGFISCWDEKYRSNLIRPETVINKYIDENWTPVLQTPPFPEYTSGHSVISGAAAVALTRIFGDNFSFNDDTETPYGLPIRSFNSFNEASSEAAMSRLYGGIHYRAAVEVGLKQGRELGNYVINHLQMTIQENSIVSH
ncbi:MAG TPA: phosphatase PAP2 family protein [Leeuwenhoekiella sp.]|nr:phosphatase PAP2 family protein [Leeuwenhoekiella sp.]